MQRDVKKRSKAKRKEISIKEVQKDPVFIDEINRFIETTKKIYKLY